MPCVDMNDYMNNQAIHLFDDLLEEMVPLKLLRIKIRIRIRL